MAQGDASQYPILPISLSIMIFCFIISLLISLLTDYIYDFYLVKFSKCDQKQMIENRVKSEFKRLKEFFQSQKLEKFDPNEAKNRLTIVTSLFMEAINSSKIGVIENVPKIEKKIDYVTKVEDFKEEEMLDKPKLECEPQRDLNDTNQSASKSQKIEKKVIINEPNKPQLKVIRENSTNKKNIQSFPKSVPSSQSSNESFKPKNFSVENKNDGLILAKETTIEDIIKKLSLAPRSATVFIEIRETKAPKPRESSPKEIRGSTVKFSPPSTICTVESDLKLNSYEINSSSGSKSKFDENKKSNNLKQSNELLEIINRKSALNKNLTRKFRDNQSKMIQERLKLDAEFRKTRYMTPKVKPNDKNKFYKYEDDDEDDSEDKNNVTKQVIE